MQRKSYRRKNKCVKNCYLLFLTFDLPEEKHLKVVLFSGTLQKVIYKCYTNLKHSTVTTLEVTKVFV